MASVSLVCTSHEHRLLEDIQDLWLAQEMCDVLLSCEDGNVWAHAPILAAFSAYFKKVLPQDEEGPIIIVLSSVSVANVFRALHFLYCGSVEVDPSDVEGLIHAGRELGIDILDDGGQLNKGGNRKAETRTSATIEEEPPDPPFSLCPSTGEFISSHSTERLDMLPDPCPAEDAAKGAYPTCNGVFGAQGPRRFPCTHCPKTFSQKFHLQQHIRIVHEGMQPFKCPACRQNFTTNSNLKQHIRRRHPSLVDAGFLSALDNRTKKKRSAVHQEAEKHVLAVDIVDPVSPVETRHLCQMCHSSFRRKSDAIDHVKVYHFGERHTCDKCGKEMLSRKSLSSHSCPSVEVVRPYHCDVCGKQFLQKSHLMQHLKLHLGIKEFRCDQCGRGYARRSYFAKHRCPTQLLASGTPLLPMVELDLPLPTINNGG